MAKQAGFAMPKSEKIGVIMPLNAKIVEKGSGNSGKPDRELAIN